MDRNRAGPGQYEKFAQGLELVMNPEAVLVMSGPMICGTLEE
jgi:hypothetical protein